MFLVTLVFFSSRQGPNLIINQPDELLESMSEWCKEHHGKVTPAGAAARQLLCDAVGTVSSELPAAERSQPGASRRQS